ncbi:DUF4030 domain-containing protein [Microbacteriaceae bacterium 4G12]
MQNRSKKLFEEIEIPSELDNKVQIGIERAEKELNKKHHSFSWISTPRNRITYVTSAAILLFSLFIGSAFFSPVMADVASKIPYLGKIFESKSIGSVVFEKLKDKGYNVGQISVQYSPKPTISIPLNQSEESIRPVQEEVRKIVKDILHARDYDAFEIKIYRNRNDNHNVSSTSLKESNLTMEVYQKLEEQGLKILILGTQPNKKTFYANILSDEKREDEIEKIILDVAKRYGMQDYTVKFSKVDMNQQTKSQEWGPIITALAEKLIGNSQYKVKQVGYSNQKEIFTLVITSSLDSSNPEAKKLAQELEKMVNDLIKSEVVNEKIKSEPYDILIESKDGKKIN